MRAVRVALLALFALAVCSAPSAHGAESEGRKKGKSKKKRGSPDANSLHAGVTPSGATKWTSDSAGSIMTTIDTSHLKFDRVPLYFASVTADARRFPYSQVNATVEDMFDGSPLVNVTGKHTPIRASNAGFSVRLRYAKHTNKTLSPSAAQLGGWRVRWVAVTEPHSVIEEARSEVEAGEDHDSVDELPVGQSLAYVKMLDRLVREDKQMVDSVLGLDFQKRLSDRPKPKAPKPPKPASDNTSDDANDTDAQTNASEEAATETTDAAAEADQAPDAAETATTQ